MTSPSNIRVFVTFKDSAIFAGEEVEAIVTIRNVEPSRFEPYHPSLHAQPVHNGALHSRTTSQATLSRPPLSRNASSTKVPGRRPPPLANPRHRPTASLNIVDSVASNAIPPRSARSTGAGIHIADSGPRDGKHNRSVSIISIGSETNSVDRRQWSASMQSPRASRPNYKHGRSASLQVSSMSGLTRSPSLNGRPVQPSPLSAASSPRFRSAESYFSHGDSFKSNGSGTVSPAGNLQHSFQFPAASRPTQAHQNGFSNSTPPPVAASPSKMRHPTSPASSISAHTRKATRIDVAPAATQRILSLASADETPRTSTDLYSVGNLSDETLASDYIAPPTRRFTSAPLASQKQTPSRRVIDPNSVQEFMMGYVQLTGSFLIDGSLVDQGPFEEAKRKAVIGGQGGGGVVGLERSKADSGFLSSFGWSNLGDSFGGFLRSGEQSSIREMKDAATTKHIPILSTPKSILFVGLKLGPGESRSFSYSIKLPANLPPSHKGRAMKVSYQLLVGMQRPSTTKNQDIRTAEMPFRVFNSVAPDGDLRIHNLMAPIIILRDEAKTAPIDPRILGRRIWTTKRAILETNPAELAAPAGNEFSSYVDYLLGGKANVQGSTLLSPITDSVSVPPSPSGDHAMPSSNGAKPSVLSTIDHAIRFASSSASGEPTAFNIARASRPIATLFISRPALRLGDSLHLLLSFADAHIPCYALDVTLESVETVDPAISMRSAASIERVTRRVWDRVTEPGFTLGWCGRWSGRLKIPWNATPAFNTSGISCRWTVRVEVVVGIEPHSRQQLMEATPEDEENEDPEAEEDNLSDTASLSTTQSEGQMVAAVPPSARTLPARAMSSSRRSASSSKPRSSKQLSRSKLNRSKLLLEDVGADERGRHFAPRQRVLCESFDLTVPIRVFGAPGGAYNEISAASKGVVI